MTAIDCVATTIKRDKIAPLGRIGALLLATDFNSEQDLRRMLPTGLELFSNRISNTNPITIKNLQAMSPDISRAVAGILPDFGVDAMIYGCTSGTLAIGSDNITQLIHKVYADIPVTNPITAVQAALTVLGVKKLAILTPYIKAINVEMAAHFNNQGYDLLSIAGLGFNNDIKMTTISPKSIYDAALETCHKDADALFISCTALRASLVIEQIEKTLNKPVVTSNQALVWHILQLLNLSNTQPKGCFGGLFNQSLR